MKTIRLYGHLGQRFGRVHRLDVQSPREAVRALCALHQGFQKAILDHDGPGFRVMVGTRDIDAKEVSCGASAETIRLIPIAHGSKGLGQIIVGAALIMMAGPVGEWLAFDLMVGSAVTGFVTGAMSTIGWSLVFGGVSQMLFSAPSTQSGSAESVTNRPSYAFNGAINTSAQGNPVPVLYGELEVGSQVISAGLYAEEIRA